MSTIPKLVHRIWFGPQPIPEEYDRWWQAWQRQMPNHEFITWTDDDLDKLPTVKEKILEARNYAEKSDIARYDILRRHGGIYLDCDIIPLHPLDLDGFAADLVHNECDWVTKDLDGQPSAPLISCANEFLAAAPGHPVLEEAVQRLLRVDFSERRDVIDTVEKTGPVFLGKLLHGHGVSLAKNAFSPYFYEEPFSRIFERSLDHCYGIHVWGNSWIPPQFQKYKLDLLFQQGDIHAVEQILHKTGINQEQYDQYVQYFRTLQETRLQLTRLAALPPLLPRLIFSQIDPILFEPFKVLYQAQTGRPRVMTEPLRILQLGASDDRLNRLIRPILINFDPELMIIDHNRWSLATMAQSLSRNKNIRYFAIGQDQDDIAWTTIRHSPEQLKALSPMSANVLLLTDQTEQSKTIHSFMDIYRDIKIIIGTKISSDPINIPHFRTFEFNGYYASYRQDLFFDYCASLFISNGIPSIFAPLDTTLFPTSRLSAV